jgi:hypothetical protein
MRLDNQSPSMFHQTMPEATVSDGLVDSMGKMQLKMQWWKQEAHQDSQRSTGQ